MNITINRYNALVNKLNDVKFTLVGDFHGFYVRDDFKKFIKTVNDNESDFLLIDGDICQGKSWQRDDNLKKIHYVMASFAEAKPVVIILGNHDLSHFSEKAYQNYKKLGDINGVYPLFNESLILFLRDNKVRITGIVPKLSTYVTASTNIKAKLGHKVAEREQEIATLVKDLKSKENLADGSLNILLSHDPRQTRMDSVYKEQSSYDLITGAHIHNGYMPNIITQKENSPLKDRDWLGVPTFGIVKNRTYSRGVIYGSNDNHVLNLPGDKWYLVIKEKYFPIEKEEAMNIILQNDYKPLVITGGVNKYVGIPIDSSEITIVDTSKTK